MNNKIRLSIVIPTWNRKQLLLSILNSLNKQSTNKSIYEIIICDSFSDDGTDKTIFDFKKENSQINLIHTNIKKNVLAAKRNHGISLSKGEIIVLLDDDCIPEQNFLNTYLELFKSIDNKTVFCGIVDYPNEIVKKNNYVRYRKSRHFGDKTNNKILDKQLKADKVVAMNMAFKKTDQINNAGYFNEDFLGYGFEDYDFGWRLIKAGFIIKPCTAKVMHLELGNNFQGYLKKIYHLGRDGMKNLLKINEEAALNSIYFKIESNKLVKFISKSSFVIKLLSLSEKIVISFEKMPYIYIPFMYRLALASAYIRGFADRKDAITDVSMIQKGWYN